MDFDDLLQETGPFGPFQFKVVSLCYIAVVFPCLAVMLDAFVNYLPDYRCRVPSCDSSCNPDCSKYQEPFLNFTTPRDGGSWDKCHYFTPLGDGSNMTTIDLGDIQWMQGSNNSSCTAENFDSDSSIECNSGYVFDTDLFSSSTVIEYELTCDRLFNLTILSFAYMLGMFFGSIVIGYIGDRYGRKMGIVVSVLVLCLGALGCVFSFNYWMLLVMRFICGFGGNGIFVFAFIIAVEYVVPQHRVAVGILINVPFSLGGVLLALIAYLVTDNWRLLTAICTLPSMLLLSLYWLLPESIRWLSSKERHEEAAIIIKNIGRMNKREVPEKYQYQQPSLMPVTSSNADLLKNYSSSSELCSLREEEKSKKSVLNLLRTPNMRKRCLISFFTWAVVTMVYYGLSANSTSLQGNVFVNFALSMLIEVPAYFLAWLILDRIGRKGSMVLVLMLAGVSCIAASLLPEELSTLIVVLSLAGKFGASAAFSIIYVYASEVFPTEYRGVGVGSCSMCARVGGLLAPLVAMLGKLYYAPLPSLVFGILALVTTALTLMLPETAGCPLPDTLQESEAFGSEQHLLYFHFLRRDPTGSPAPGDPSPRESQPPSSVAEHPDPQSNHSQTTAASEGRF